MVTYEDKQIQELPLSVPLFRSKVESFLESNDLRLERVDSYVVIQDTDGRILGGGGLSGDVIKCVAVSEDARSQGLAAPLVSRLVSVGGQRGYSNLKVFTKPSNQPVFESLGFRLLAASPSAVFMENGMGLQNYCRYLKNLAANVDSRAGSVVIIMNANPFHKGHLGLVEKAAGYGLPVFVIVVSEERSRFSYLERLAMVREGLPLYVNGVPVTVCEGSPYQISSATFPSYFLKELSEASATQMALDLDLFGKHVAPALGCKLRVVGSEPCDELTARYNVMMHGILPSFGVEVAELPRLGSCVDAGSPFSGTEIRSLIDSDNGFAMALCMVPRASQPYLLAERASWALKKELSTSQKPGLVGPASRGAHQDMDYDLMLRGIKAIRPALGMIALCETADELIRFGKEAEKSMLEATGGVNTHQGAVFSMGLFLAALHWLSGSVSDQAALSRAIAAAASSIPDTPRSRKWDAEGVKGALRLARDGYRPLFDDWLPFYRSLAGDRFAAQKTLLRIMCTLDDTCVIRRAGVDRARRVKGEALQLLENFTEAGLERLCRRYEDENISPGGAADMLALTFLANDVI